MSIISGWSIRGGVWWQLSSPIRCKVGIVHARRQCRVSHGLAQVRIGNGFDLALEIRRGLLEIGHLDVISASITITATSCIFRVPVRADEAMGH